MFSFSSLCKIRNFSYFLLTRRLNLTIIDGKYLLEWKHVLLECIKFVIFGSNILLTSLKDIGICLFDVRLFCMKKKLSYLILKERFEWNLFQVLLSLLLTIHVFLVPFCNLKKQPLEVFYKEKCSEKCCKIHRKTPVPEFLC